MYNGIIRTFRTVAVALALILPGIYTVSAQEYANTPVSISKDKVRINGQVCYSHVVLERQTLFSICKAYNVSAEDLYRYNPSLKESGLKKNSIIIIPAVTEDVAETVTVQKEAVHAPVQEAVKEKEETAAAEAETKDSSKKKKRKTHTVKWYENLDDIAEKYGVNVSEIMAANKLDSKNIKSRMKLTIPEPGEYASEINGEDMTVQADTVITTDNVSDKVIADNETEEHPWWADFNRKGKVTASLMLPFKATGTSGSRSNMDFYSGVLLAVNDLAQAGTSVDLNVIDIADNIQSLGNIDLTGNDIVMGPVSVKDMTEALSASGSSSMFISPLDPKAESLVSGNPDLIQAPTPHKIQYMDLASWLKEDTRPEDRVLLISEKGARLTESTFEMKQAADAMGVPYKTFSYSILEGRDVEKPLKELMTQTATNRVMIVSESEAFVNDVVRNLNMMIHQKYEIVLYGASKIRSFETIEVENFHKTNLHVSLTYYIDYDDPRVKNFLLKYRALFNAEPTQFAFQGYDIASYFIELCSKYGKNWQDKMSHEEKSMLQSTFKCMKDGDGGYINHGVRRIVYGKDWTISKVR